MQLGNGAGVVGDATGNKLLSLASDINNIATQYKGGTFRASTQFSNLVNQFSYELANARENILNGNPAQIDRAAFQTFGNFTNVVNTQLSAAKGTYGSNKDGGSVDVVGSAVQQFIALFPGATLPSSGSVGAGAGSGTSANTGSVGSSGTGVTTGGLVTSNTSGNGAIGADFSANATFLAEVGRTSNPDQKASLLLSVIGSALAELGPPSTASAMPMTATSGSAAATAGDFAAAGTMVPMSGLGSIPFTPPEPAKPALVEKSLTGDDLMSRLDAGGSGISRGADGGYGIQAGKADETGSTVDGKDALSFFAPEGTKAATIEVGGLFANKDGAQEQAQIKVFDGDKLVKTIDVRGTDSGNSKAEIDTPFTRLEIAAKTETSDFSLKGVSIKQEDASAVVAPVVTPMTGAISQNAPSTGGIPQALGSLGDLVVSIQNSTIKPEVKNALLDPLASIVSSGTAGKDTAMLAGLANYVKMIELTPPASLPNTAKNTLLDQIAKVVAPLVNAGSGSSLT